MTTIFNEAQGKSRMHLVLCKACHGKICKLDDLARDRAGNIFQREAPTATLCKAGKCRGVVLQGKQMLCEECDKGVGVVTESGLGLFKLDCLLSRQSKDCEPSPFTDTACVMEVPQDDARLKLKGVITTFVEKKKFGFIKSIEATQGTKEFFFHIRDFDDALTSPQKGQKVKFLLAPGKHGKRLCAKQVQYEDIVETTISSIAKCQTSKDACRVFMENRLLEQDLVQSQWKDDTKISRLTKVLSALARATEGSGLETQQKQLLRRVFAEKATCKFAKTINFGILLIQQPHLFQEYLKWLLVCIDHVRVHLDPTLKGLSLNFDAVIGAAKRMFSGVELGNIKSRPVNLETRTDLLTFAEYLKHASIQIQFQAKPEEHELAQPPKHNLYEFRSMNTDVPSKEELEQEIPHLRKVQRAYHNTVDYLDSMYRLLREDFVRPLREARKLDSKGHSGLAIQEQVKIGALELAQGQLVHKLYLSDDATKAGGFWDKLSYGALLLVVSHERTFQELEDMLWAVVINTDNAARGQVGVKFLGTRQVPLAKHSTELFMIAETPAYYEAYVHALARLQTLDRLPVDDSIWVSGHFRNNNGSNVPAHLHELGKLDFSNLYYQNDDEPRHRYNINETLPRSSCKLDDSQLVAFEEMFKRKISLTQGPPGTGKSFVATKLVQCLVANKEIILGKRGEREGKGMRILLLGHSNHAIDQFLRSILELGIRKVCRIGSRTQDEGIAKYSIRSLIATKNTRKAQDLRLACTRYRENLVRIDELLRSLETEILPSLEDLQACTCYPEELMDELKRLGAWVNDYVNPCETDTDGFTKVSKKGKRQRTRLKAQLLEDVKEHEKHARIWRSQQHGAQADSPGHIAQVRERLRLESDKAYQAIFIKLSDKEQLFNIERTRVMLEELEGIDIIASTVNGLVRLPELAAKLDSFIIIIEEAAELCEPQLIASVPSSAEQLVLIGDHLQLKPKTSDYFVGRKLGLATSVFERLIDGRSPFNTLVQQRRMHPLISRLARPLYPHLQDHARVNEYLPVPGLNKNLIFVDHHVPEDTNGFRSKENKHEAGFLLALALYLIQNGNKGQDIAILAPYNGQKRLLRMLKDDMLKSGTSLRNTFLDEELKQVTIKSIDDVQGEEYGIVMVSLVRGQPVPDQCPQAGKQRRGKAIGFIGEEDRINVALSRAKQGLIVMGNFSHLQAYSPEWQVVLDQVDDENKVDRVALHVHKHSCNNPVGVSAVTVATAVDFEQAPDGGCSEKCHARLSCGHVCTLACHPFSHDSVRCPKVCNGKMTCGHVCKRLCYTCRENGKCLECLERVSRELPCGHKREMECHKDPLQASCMVLTEKTFSCGHKNKIRCSEPEEESECTFVCGKDLACGHLCSGKCGECNGDSHVPCNEKRTVPLPCGHQSADALTCSDDCPPCAEQCQLRCIHAKCDRTCSDICAPCREKCSWACRPMCPNKYYCSNLCGEDCNRKRCDRRCPEILTCGHPCLGLCGEKCPPVCAVCKPKDEFFDESVTEENLTELTQTDCIFQMACCKNVVSVKCMDRHVEVSYNQESDSNAGFRLLTCPICRATLYDYPLRYSRQVKEQLAFLTLIKERILHKLSSDELASIKQQLESRLREHLLCKKVYGKALEMIQSNVHTCNALFIRAVGELCTLVTGNGLEKRSKCQHINAFIEDFLFALLENPGKFTHKQVMNQLQKALFFALLDQHQISDKELVQLVEGITSQTTQTELDRIADQLGSKVTVMVLVSQGTGTGAGHWYKCKNCEEPFLIGNCGGAVVEAKCIQCKTVCGGTGHRLNQNSTIAPEVFGNPNAYSWDDGTGRGAVHRI
mmetsp:Transcript_13248/g.23752  ORF Transcript_13248/g.23752 Transcript_13248/m.23752 type:complete len:1826 (+) Transcript_13248:159-5636(+)|eukprot:CAMPEP_0203751090 /NCGR_PEP_ID=MMETSP0098-20131031/5218_1 /ASSEMBLY_ACC=CAM_ASM_000208 /TAXON_ID=96639 /ORGANISM=" , Strain NY0313808BC1" /LENGTH=1825 /DNA_ID=CAMNT_0050640657 /DNA_START=115 /DNA_END=5592 /DNA_ORIENTATION=+